MHSLIESLCQNCSADETISVTKKCRKYAISKLIFDKFSGVWHSPQTPCWEGATVPLADPLGDLRASLWTIHLPYLEIKSNALPDF